MNVKENNNWMGKFHIKIKGKEEIIYNRILDTALNAMAQFLLDGTGNIVPAYLSLGTENASISNTLTNMGSETFRTAIAVAPTISGTGEVKNTFYILNTEAKFYIKEMGIWGGSTATTTIGSGLLIAYATWDYDKTSKDEEIEIIRYDTFNRGV